MIDSSAATRALRNRMLTLDTVKVCTTGAVSLSATATGYRRTTGSFLADRFADGMEFLAAGFATAANNGYRVIESVSDLEIFTSSAVAMPTVEAEAAGRTLSVGLPLGRAFENRPFYPKGGPFAGRPYIDEDYVPGAHAVDDYPSQGATNQERGFYQIKWYGLEGKGDEGIKRPTDALKALFAPGTVLNLGDGTRVRMLRNPAVTAGQVLPQGDGWAVRVVSVPWAALSNNVIAA